MDKSWMKKKRGDREYVEGVLSFVKFASLHARGGKILCPCTKCVNLNLVSPGVAQAHLWTKGMLGSYTHWNRWLCQQPLNVGVVMCKTPMNNTVTFVGCCMICAPCMKWQLN